MKRIAAVVGLVAMLSATGVAAAEEQLLDCGIGSAETVETFRVETKTPRNRIYTIGDVIKLRVKVHRQIDGHDLGPAEGADVAVALSRNDEPGIYGGGITNEEGIAKVRVRVSRGSPIGLLDLFARATVDRGHYPCLRVTEIGNYEAPAFLRIVK